MLPISTATACVDDRLPPKVAVIGGGAAGLCAAIEAAKLGASVVIFEKMSKLGGNSAKASSGINGCETVVQKEWHVSDSKELFRNDTCRVGCGKNHDLELVNKLVERSSEAIDFLKDEIGLPLTDLLQLGGHSAARTHRLSTHAPIGWSMIEGLRNYVCTMSNIEVRTSTNVLGLMYRDELEDVDNADGSSGNSNNNCSRRIITGLTYEWNTEGELPERENGGTNLSPQEQQQQQQHHHEAMLEADAVIITTGGSAFDQSSDGLMAEFAPHLLGMATSSGSQATGQGIQMARRVGAGLTNPDLVQLHPTGFVDPSAPAQLSKILAPEALRGSGGILLNHSGKRFCDELGRRGYVTEQILAHCAPYKALLSSGRGQHTALMLLNGAAVKAFGTAPMEFYVKRGLVRKYPHAAALCASEGMTVEALEETLATYRRVVQGEEDCCFGKKRGSGLPAPTMDEELFVASITPVIHYTLGGISVGVDTSVRHCLGRGLDSDVSGCCTTTDTVSSQLLPSLPLVGLYAAGEVTGGVHGGDRLAGNSLLECVVFGRIAGNTAVSDTVVRVAMQKQQE